MEDKEINIERLTQEEIESLYNDIFESGQDLLVGKCGSGYSVAYTLHCM